MFHRFLEKIAFSDIFSRQMRFIAGPRQSGKTTLAKTKLKQMDCAKYYYNWDTSELRDRQRKELDFLRPDMSALDSRKGKTWVCFDEIHKYPKWKNILKSYFDTYEDKVNFIVTGSAMLDLMRKSGDSLAGRYFIFRLNPLMLAEVAGAHGEEILIPGENSVGYIESVLQGSREEKDSFAHLLRYGAFPEPLLNENDIFAKKWHRDYVERIVKEDLRDLSTISHLEKVMELTLMLPDKVGAPLSINSLREDLEMNFSSVKNYINYLQLSYILFLIPPYSRKNSRLVRKEKKLYFYDWALIENEGKRFENFVALELKSRIELWNESSKDSFDLFFVRGREGYETDFLLTRNNTPYILIEAKLSENNIEPHHYRHSSMFDGIPFIQLVRQNGVLERKSKGCYVLSASRFLSGFFKQAS